MIRKILWLLLWLVLGFYLGIRFSSWFGVDLKSDVENVFVFLENSIVGAFQLAYTWIISLFNGS
jgi:hypothetical protein